MRRVKRFVVSGSYVVTMNAGRQIIKDGAVVVEKDRIVAVGKKEDILSQYPGVKVISGEDKMVLPGIIDSHLHLTQTLARGLTDDIDGVKVRWSWDRVYPWESELTEEDVYNSALMCILECIKNGTTTVNDPGGFHMDAVARAIEDTGLRGIIALSSMDQMPPGWELPEKFAAQCKSTEKVIAESENLIHRWNGKADGRIKVWTGLRVEPNCSPALIKGISELAGRYNVSVHTHLCVSKIRNEWVFKTTGMTPLKYFDSLDALGPNWLAVHMGWVTDEELEIIKNYDMKIAHNVGAALHNGMGSARIGKFPEMFKIGISVSLGTDSTAANNSLDMFEEMYHVATVHKEVRGEPTLVKPEEALEMATVASARNLGWDDEIGSLEVGKKADITIVDIKKSNYIPYYDFNLIPNLVYSCKGANVNTVIVNGKVLMRDRKVLVMDEDKVLETAQSTAQKLISKLPYKIEPRWPVI